MPKKLPKHRLSLSQRQQILIGAALIIAVALLVVWQSQRAKSTAPKTPSPSITASPSPSSTSIATPTPTSPPQGTAPPTAAPTPSSSLPKPTGQMLNKPEVHLNESNAASQYGSGMDSTCQTVAGASCGLEITSDKGVVKSIAPKPTVENNGLYVLQIIWDAKNLGLTPGIWQVRAVATKNGQTSKSAPESLKVTQ